MLVLSRNVGEKIIFPNTGITLTVVGVKRNGAVKLGIEAPADVIIKREEVLEKEEEVLKKEKEKKRKKV